MEGKLGEDKRRRSEGGGESECSNRRAVRATREGDSARKVQKARGTFGPLSGAGEGSEGRAPLIVAITTSTPAPLSLSRTDKRIEVRET